MEDQQNAGTPPPPVEAPQQDNSPAVGTPPVVDDVTTLRSRNAGLDAKVTSLAQTLKQEKDAREAAERKLNDHLTGKVNDDEDTRALLQRLNSELEASKTEAKVSGLAAKYPETFAVYGSAISGMTEDALAAGEARLLGIPNESNTPPVPVGNNAQRAPAQIAKPVEEMSLAELKEYSKGAFQGLTWDSLTQ